MKKNIIRHVSPLRFGIVLGLLTGFLGMLVAPVMLFAGAAIAATEMPKLLGIPWLFVGAGALFMPLIHAVGGFLLGVLLAMLYNLAARWTGGVEFYTDDTN